MFLGVMCSQDSNKVSRVQGSGFRVETVTVWASYAAAEGLFEAQLSDTCFLSVCQYKDCHADA